MNLSISGRTKHRLIGVVVLLALAVIFLPAILKESNQNFEKNIKMALKFPSKPAIPRIDAPSNQVLFKQAKIAKAPIVEISKIQKSSIIAKASSLNNKVQSKQSIEVAKAISNINHNDVKIKIAEQMFSIQVATFTQRSNADILVEKLKNHDYLASYNVINSERGTLYQVVVGKLTDRDEAINLQKKLAANMQLNGFIVQSGVS